jgi:hypothetical protein
MSTEYLVAIEAAWGRADRALVEKAFALVKARVAPYKIEIAFESLGEQAEHRLSRILDAHPALFRALESFTATPDGVVLRWNGYGVGEPFLEQALLLLGDMGLAGMQGQAVGDEGAYRCHVQDGQLCCEAVDVDGL